MFKRDYYDALRVTKRFRTMLAALLALWAQATVPAVAQADIPFADRALIQLLSNHDDTLRLEREIATRLERGDKAELQRLAQKFSREEGALLARIARSAKSSDQQEKAFALAMGPCQQAGIAIRTIAIDLGAGKLQVAPHGKAFRTVPSDAGDEFALMANICERVRSLPRSTRSVGTACYVDGTGCT